MRSLADTERRDDELKPKKNSRDVEISHDESIALRKKMKRIKASGENMDIKEAILDANQNINGEDSYDARRQEY